MRGAKLFLSVEDLREGASFERKVLSPERLARIRLALSRNVMNRIDRLARVLIAKAEVERQVVFDAPVILEVIELVGLVVGQIERPDSQVDERRAILNYRIRAREAEGSKHVGQERHFVGETADVSAHLQLVLAKRFREVIRELVVLHNAALRKVCRAAD